MGSQTSNLIAVDDGATGAQTPYAPEEMVTMLEYLPDFVFQHHSSKADQALMLAHWDALFVQAAQASTTAPSPMVVFFDAFYDRLFGIAPDVKPLFRSSMKVQGKALIRIVEAIKGMLQSPNLVAYAADLAARHVRYGIKMTHFNALGVTLMTTLETCSKELWSPETALAWRKVYGHVALIVLTELGRLQPGRRRPVAMKTFAVRSVNAPTFEPGHPHYGQALDPNAMCPVSGNTLKSMKRPPPTSMSQRLSERVLGVFGMGTSIKYANSSG